jgi:hypothetical protein
LKGSGWYETDFKNKSETKRNLVEHGGGSSEAADKSTDTAAKDEAGKAVAAAKESSAAEKPEKPEKPAKPKPSSAKPAAARTAKSKSRAKAARG